MDGLNVIVRAATPDDAPAMLGIYRPFVEATAVSFEESVPTTEGFAQRIETCLGRYPWLVCTVNGVVAGYAYAAVYNERAAYQWTCLSSIYLAAEWHGKGLARPLYDTLFAALKLQGFQTVFALITLPNAASIGLHERCGFRPFTTFEKVGYKLGRWQTVGWWRLTLGDFPAQPESPIAFHLLPPARMEPIYAGAQASIARVLGQQ